MDCSKIFQQIEGLVDQTLAYVDQVQEDLTYGGKKHRVPAALPLQKKILEPPKEAAPSPINVEPPLELRPLEPKTEFLEKKSVAPLPLKPLQKKPGDTFHDLHTMMKTLAPQLIAEEPTPSDFIAKKLRHSWKHPLFHSNILLIGGQETTHHFLNQVAQAIDMHFFPSTMIPLSSLEKQALLHQCMELESIKLIIIPAQTLWNCKELMTHYHEIPQKKQRYLGKKLVLILPEIDLYFNDPLLKRSLWNQLCQVMKTLP